MCRDRAIKKGGPCAGTTFENVKPGLVSHSDIVVEVASDHIVVLGGNTSQTYPKLGLKGNTVGQKKIKLDQQGFVLANQGSCKYFAIVKPPRAVLNASGNPQILNEPGKWPVQLLEFVRQKLLPFNIALAIFLGQRDENLLTNLVFSAQHPDLPKGYKIKDSEQALAKEWLGIRTKLIRPLLAKLNQNASPLGAQRGTSATPQVLRGNLSNNAFWNYSSFRAERLRRFRLTTYHVVDQDATSASGVNVPVLDSTGNTITAVSPEFFARMALNGTGLLTDKRLINVTGKRVSVNHNDYEAVLRYHQLKLPSKPLGYSGLFVEGARITQVLSFAVVENERLGLGFGVGKKGIPYAPFRTLAADLGNKQRHDPRFKAKGGLVPAGTRVYIKEFDGLSLPDSTTHDGWFVVNDTGGGIFGAHFDVFTGHALPQGKFSVPRTAHVWFPDIADRIQPGYTLGLIL